jgi:hypothetical protein
MQPHPGTAEQIAAPRRIAEHDNAPTRAEGHDIGEEPHVDVPAGLLGRAIELLDLLDELLNRPGHDCIDAHLRDLVARDEHTIGATTTRWAHEALPATADELQTLLDITGIVVEPTLRHRPHQTTRRTYAP